MTFSGTDPRSAPVSEPETHLLVLSERQEENKIHVPDDLPLTDPLVLKTQRLLHRGKRDSAGLTQLPLAVSTSAPRDRCTSVRCASCRRC